MELARFFLYVLVMVCAWVFVCDVFFFSHSVSSCPASQANQKKDRPHGRAAMPWGGVGVGISHMHLVGNVSSKSGAQMGCYANHQLKWLSRYYWY